ncbi:MAG: asparaginase [candidate division KSB1 bacterium]|nr:asparaginase [candidate division KSB1 bacterium]MDZ7301750.1 asparaginase [candidate division KSB1 bacterium]MDZ7311471.1 asparaginase [candidate division KSB1 bacterium]
MAPPALLANVTRGGRIESQHFGHLVVVDAEAKPVFTLGDPRFVTYIRSAAKPFQAMPLYDDAVPEVFRLRDDEMAVMMSSHNGEPKHIDAVASILRKIGLRPEDLQCGIHAPLGAEALRELNRRGGKPTVLHNNCSGKHAGMLAACVNRGWPIENYLHPDHPHQQRILQTIARWAWLPVTDIGVAIDGCSAPNFAMPLFNIARMYATLVSSNEANARRILQTFANAPDMIAGEERFDTDLIRVTNGRLIAKMGMEGIQCIGVCGNYRLGIAIKISDGSHRATSVVALALLQKLKLISADEYEQLVAYHRIVVHNHRHLATGLIEAAI